LNKRRIGGYRGFTLTELMIALVVVAILAGIAMAVYGSNIERTRRTLATIALDRLYMQQESFRNSNNTFTADLDALGFPGGCTENCVYTIDFTVAPTTRTYTARAVPTPGGGTNGVDQTGDDDCQWFTIDARGARLASSDDCWGR
jgi:type IV pilus assembly protein PilE